MRYDKLYHLVGKIKPEVILETGTWKGRSARKMLEQSPKSKYFGFDVFEDATPEFNLQESNGKKRCEMESTKGFLHGFDVELIKGNTRETLPKFVERGQKIDFAFIDGGHSVETIKSDFENILKILKPGGTVVFDDYYDGTAIDTKKFGCNEVVKDIPHTKIGGEFDDKTKVSIFMVVYEHKV